MLEKFLVSSELHSRYYARSHGITVPRKKLQNEWGKNNIGYKIIG